MASEGCEPCGGPRLGRRPYGSRSSGRVRTGREPVPDASEACQVVHIAGQGADFGDRHLRVERREAVACALLACQQLHALRVQSQ